MQIKKQLLITAIVLLPLLYLSCGDDNGDWDATGSFEATEVIVSSQANGRLLELNVTEGEQLEAGQVVGQIDSTQLYLQKMALLSNAREVRAEKPNIDTQTAASQ